MELIENRQSSFAIDFANSIEIFSLGAILIFRFLLRHLRSRNSNSFPKLCYRALPLIGFRESLKS